MPRQQSSPPSSLAAAGQWLEAVVLGNVGTTLAVIAVAWIGFAMLSGRLSLRRGAGVVFGMAILFGSQAIARGIMGQVNEAPLQVGNTTLPPQPIVKPSAPPLRDPYAGASVPQ